MLFASRHQEVVIDDFFDVEADGGVPFEESPEFYLTGDLSEERTELLDKLMTLTFEQMKSMTDVLEKSAKAFGRDCVPITLREAQVLPVLMSYVNPRFFLGDKPGLGKTVMSGASYAYYRYFMKKKGQEPKKVLVVTDSSHVLGFAGEWNTFGLKVVPLVGGKVARALKKHDPNDCDGFVINWDGLKTNAFLEYYLEHADEFGFAIFDETSALLNPKSMLYQTANHIINKYRGGIERVIFLNGSSFEKNLFDIYHQFQILMPKLIPNKDFLESRYVVRSGREVFMHDMSRFNPFQKHVVKRKTGEIADYQNLEELRNRLKYYYVARSKQDYASDLPKHNYRLHVANLTSEQKKRLSESSNMSNINSPKTSDPNAKFTLATAPKLKAVVEFAQQTEEDRPLVYVYNKESQKTMKEELEAVGYRVGILNGDIAPAEKAETLRAFNTGNLDMLVFNVEKAINIPTSDRIIFYDIPMMPQRTNQITGRIDRNNYEVKKFYDFFCYNDSPEMVNLVRLAYFRETHGENFTGQRVGVYAQLVRQLHAYFSTETLETVEEMFDRMEAENGTFADIEQDVRRALGLD
ncbi:hypothetical protein CN495_08095 [Bacillus thuringiensis]|uniref:Helicase C-terminal domain-containing protein n=1 Tax=Bacillus thuringiensis TaxID=1428 RepID=A0ABD6S794_BACTU|nr:DEAD/DEAH box helicase [Bacillus thuringiensis]PER55704.1 hypothetical protein CN495_08095 [Bacillus thuringiensis]